MSTLTPSADWDIYNQLLPHIVDHYAQVKPDAIYAEYPINPMSYDDGYRPITYKAFANAINGLAKWLTETLGPGHGETLSYLGPNDLRYPALVMAALKAGYCMFMTSPRNSAAAHQSLFTKLDCQTLLVPVPRPPFIAGILEAHPLNVVEVPGLDELLTTEYPHVEFTKTYPEAASERMAIIHTSGSTGIPKPVIWTHDSAVKHMHMNAMAPPEGHECQGHWGFGKRMYLTLPPFHAAGLGHMIFVTMPVDTTIIIPTAAGLPTAAALVAARKQTPFEFAMVPPSLLQELAQTPELLDYCSTHLEFLCYGGGDVPQEIGNAVARKVKLVNAYGASELGNLSLIHSTANRDPLTDWRYLHFHPATGVEYRHVSGDEYEMVLVRTPEREAYQFTFTIFPELQEYHPNDLMVRHPDPAKPDLWRPSARTDDIIVFLNGEKTNPVSMEQHIITTNPEVTGALVAGSQRFQAVLLVELGLSAKALSMSERAAIIEKLWPSIEHANTQCPAHARIAKSHILFTTPEKPMLRAGKGTVQRAGTLALYAQEFDALYADADKLAQQDAGDLVGPGSVDDTTQVEQYIREVLVAITGWETATLSATENWFNLGLDSLQAITTTRILKQGLNLPSLSPNVIYLHPTVAGLAHAVQHLHQHREQSAEAHQQALLQEREQLFDDLIQQIHLPTTSNPPKPSPPTTHTVLLTGSTGQLGTYLLNTLLQTPTVEHIYCLNRNPNAQALHETRITTHHLTPLPSSRVHFLTADLTQPDLGLPPAQLQHLQQTTTLIIHNAWTVNFNLSLPSFQPNLTGVVNLINFTAQATHTLHLFYISSMSSTFGHHTPTTLTPESIITTTTPAPNAYANSKYLAEHLLAHVARQAPHLHLHPAIARVGQIAGPVRSPGLWSKSEWFPSLVLSALHLNALPESLAPTMNRVDWVPIDLLAEILVELAIPTPVENEPPRSEVQVYHPVNLHARTWTDIRPMIADALAQYSSSGEGEGEGEGKSLEIIPIREWVKRIRYDVESGTSRSSKLGERELQALLAKNPAAKLLDFFEEVVATETGEENGNVLDTRITAEKSLKLRGVDAVKKEWILKWIGEWLV